MASCPSNFSVCVDLTPFALTGGTPIGGTYSGTGVSAGNFDPAAAGVGVHTITYTAPDTSTCTFDITVNALPFIGCPGNSSVCVNVAPYALLGGSPGGGTYSGVGVSGGIFDPGAAGAGTHAIFYTYTDGNGCSNTCSFNITVNPLPTVIAPSYAPVPRHGTPVVLSGGTPIGGTYSGPGVSGGIFTPSSVSAGIHILSYSWTHPVTGCIGSSTFNMTVKNLTGLYPFT